MWKNLGAKCGKRVGGGVFTFLIYRWTGSQKGDLLADCYPLTTDLIQRKNPHQIRDLMGSCFTPDDVIPVCEVPKRESRRTEALTSTQGHHRQFVLVES